MSCLRLVILTGTVTGFPFKSGASPLRIACPSLPMLHSSRFALLPLGRNKEPDEPVLSSLKRHPPYRCCKGSNVSDKDLLAYVCVCKTCILSQDNSFVTLLHAYAHHDNGSEGIRGYLNLARIPCNSFFE